MKKIFTTAAIAVAISVSAATQNASMTTSAPAASTTTNSNSDSAMAALFGDPVIVKGRGFEIKRSDLDQVLTGAKANAAAQGQMVPPDLEVQILNQLTYVQLMLQKATDADRAAGKLEADAQMKKILASFASSEAFDRQLKVVGMTRDGLLAKATQESTAKAALRRELNVTVTDAEVKDYYTSHPATFEDSESVALSDILVLTIDPATRSQLPTDQQQDKRKKIDDALKRARSGENFTNLAAELSEDPNSKETGGALPPLTRDQLPPELAAAAFSLTNSQISDVIETPYGYYIVKLREKIPAKKQDFDSVADDIKTALTSQKIRLLAPDYVAKLKKEYDVQILDPSLKTLAAALETAATNAPAATPDK